MPSITNISKFERNKISRSFGNLGESHTQSDSSILWWKSAVPTVQQHHTNAIILQHLRKVNIAKTRYTIALQAEDANLGPGFDTHWTKKLD